MIAGKVIHFVDSSYPDLTPERLFRFEKQLNFLPIANDAIDCLFGRRDKELTDTINTKRQANLIHQHAGSQGLADMLQKAQRVLLTAVPDTVGESCYHGGLNDFVWKQLWPVSLAAVGAAESTSAIATEEAVPYFRAFDSAFPFLVSGAPIAFFPAANCGRQHLINAMADMKFLLSQTGLCQERYNEAKRTGMTDLKDFGRLQLVLLWAVIANTAPTAFWAIFHILHDPEAKRAVQEEVENIVIDKKELCVEQLDQLHVLHSCIQETLRHYSESMIIRQVMEDFELDLGVEGLDKYTLLKGTRVAIMMSRLHMDGAVFENPHTFKWDRFIDPNKIFSKNGNALPTPVRPFGGGSSICHGRNFAVYELKLFLVRLFCDYEIELMNNNIPRVDQTRIGLGIYGPEADVKIRVTRRYEVQS